MTDTEQRRARLSALVAHEPFPADAATGMSSRLHRICRALVKAIPASGAGITLMDASAFPAGVVAVSGERFRQLEDLQFTLGEGPCIDAYASRRPVLEHCLAEAGVRRWPVYATAARGLGVGSVFAFPMQVGAARLGVLDVYRDEAAPLGPDELSDALGFARMCRDTLLDGHAAGPGGVLATGLGEAVDERAEVYQAQGAVMIQLGVSLPDAAARLRSYAFAHNRALSDVARDVLAGIVVFARDKD